MLELSQQKAKVVAVTPNSVMHGKEPDPVTYITLQAVVSNDVLTCLDGRLKAAFFMKDASAKQEEILAGTLPLLKFPDMGRIPWGYKGAGYTLTVHYGIDGRSDIVLADCIVDNISTEFQQGGSVLLKFKVAAHPDDLQGGRLGKMVKQIVDITLDPPEESEQQQNAA